MLQGKILCDTFVPGVFGDGDPAVADDHTGMEGTGWQLLDLWEPHFLFLFPWHKIPP
jgi:hypothetical protein